jgi:hypothetical protein
MSIQVEMPKWWLAMDADLTWHIFWEGPTVYAHDKEWREAFCNNKEGVTLKVSIVENNVTGFDGNWKDSLHQYINGEWVKV